MSSREAGGRTGTGLVLASRGDPLTPHLLAALRKRYQVLGQISPELTQARRLLVAARTFRPNRSRWAEQFFKSNLGYRLRSANAAAALKSFAPTQPVLQVHALFEVPNTTNLLYVDCTHRQSADHWPAWNPLSGRALQRWYDAETHQYRSAEHVFAFSQWTSRSLVDDYGVDPHRVSVVSIGANFVHPPRQRRRAQAPPTVLMVGNDFVRKGGEVLLEAFSRVRRIVPGSRLVLVGTTPRLTRVPDGVVVKGRIHDREEVSRLFQEADVFAMPSLFDPLPQAVLEAMAHGVPVVASRVCGIPDVVEDGVTGHLVRPADPVELADTIVQVLQEPRRAAGLGRAGQQRMLERFQWEHVVDRMSPVLDRLLV